MKLCNILVIFLAAVAAVSAGDSESSSSSSSSYSSLSGWRGEAAPSDDVAVERASTPSLRGIAPSDERAYNAFLRELAGGANSRRMKHSKKKKGGSKKVKSDDKSGNVGGADDGIDGDGEGGGNVVSRTGNNRAANRANQCAGAKKSCDAWEPIPDESLCETDGECASCCCVGHYFPGQYYMDGQRDPATGMPKKKRGCMDMEELTDAALNSCVNPRMVEEGIDTGDGGLDGGDGDENNLDSNQLP